MSPPTNPFLSPDGDESLTENPSIASTSGQSTIVPTPPARAQLHDSCHEIEEWPLPSPILNATFDKKGPFATPSPSLYAEGARNLSEPSLLWPVHLGRTSSCTDRGWDEQVHPFCSSRASPGTSHNSTPCGNTYALPLVRPETPPPPLLRSYFQTTRQAVFNHVDPKTIREMIDFRELVYPFGVWKYTILALVGMAIAGIVVSEHYTHWIDASMTITRRNMLPTLIIVLGLEPIMFSIVLLVARVPDLMIADAASSDIEGQMQVSEKMITKADVVAVDIEARLQVLEKARDRPRTALVIPCHFSDEAAVKKVLESAYPHFRPQDIFIVDNGRTKYPPNNFRQFIREQHPDIVYIWSPIGSKNAAQLAGALAAKDYDFIMTVDDDVSIPANFSPPIDRIDHLTKGVAFPLRAIDAHGRSPLFMVAWQDCEYKMSGLSKLAESALCGVLYPHGAGWFCERDTLIDLISNYHSLDFIAEDVNTGLSMQKMKKRIAFDARLVLETEVPTTIFGPGLNWWHQRKNSWEVGRHGRLLGFVGRLLLSLNGQRTIQGIVAQKFIHSYAIASIVVDWLRVPVLVTMGADAVFWRQALLLMLVSMAPLMAFKYINARKRPDLQPRFWACLTYPFYKQLYAFVSIMGAMRCVTHYIGGHKRPPNVRKMMDSNDERVFWKDPRFGENPAFLADEGEALRRSTTDTERSPGNESAIRN